MSDYVLERFIPADFKSQMPTIEEFEDELTRPWRLPKFARFAKRKKGTMKKDFGTKTWMLPMPVLMIATYGEDGTPDVMNAAWGGTGSEDLLTICIDNTHKPLAFDPLKHVYRGLTAPVAKAFQG